MSEDGYQPDRSTRERILSVATELFTARGFANVSVREICEGAGVTPPTIYHYYGNKDGLFQAVVRRAMSLEDFRDLLVHAIEEQSDPEAQLRAFIHDYLASFPKHLVNPGLFLQDSTQLASLSADRFVSEFEAIDELAQGVIENGMEAGTFRRIDPARATTCLMNMLVSFVLGEAYFNQTHDPDEMAPFIFDLFLAPFQDDFDIIG